MPEKPFLFMNDKDIFRSLFWDDIYFWATETLIKNVLEMLWINKNTTKRYVIYKYREIDAIKLFLKNHMYGYAKEEYYVTSEKAADKRITELEKENKELKAQIAEYDDLTEELDYRKREAKRLWRSSKNSW